MGYSYGMNPVTGRMMLACDNCSAIGGVRRVKCPAGWCPSAALCAKCRPLGLVDHSTCAASHADYLVSELALDTREVAR